MTTDQRLGLAELILKYQYINPDEIDKFLDAVTDNQRKRFWALHFNKDKSASRIEILKMINSIQWYITRKESNESV
jgi:hypothetical protein